MDNLEEIKIYVKAFKDLGVKSFSDVKTGIAVEFFEGKEKEPNYDAVDDSKDEIKEKKFGGMLEHEIKEFI